MKRMITGCILAIAATGVWAKLPPAPPKPPEVLEAEKAKAADAAKKDAELNAKYMDKAVASWAAKARADGKEFKPQLGEGVPPPPAPAAPAMAAAQSPSVAAAPSPAQAGAPVKK